MARKRGSSERWLREHERDPYVQRARREGRIARSAYKLAELDKRDKLLRPGMVVVDLGAAPGGWAQVAQALVGDAGRVIATDILPIEPLPGVEVVTGDFTDDDVALAIVQHLNGGKADLVISDMAPNLSGMKAIDQPRAMYLAELALDMASQILRPGGVFLTKVFQGEGFEEYLKSVREQFGRVVSRKPDASRTRSREQYLLARDFRGGG